MTSTSAGTKPPASSASAPASTTQTGRFINRDPLGYGGGMNLYGYADDDPVNGFDPMGMSWASNFGSSAAAWYYGGMGGLSDAVDNSPFFGGATAALGQAAGDYDSGCGSAAAQGRTGLRTRPGLP